MPRDINNAPLTYVRRFWHKRFFRHFPDDTAMTVRKIFAATAPEKILSADMFGPAAKARSASCVRSPNSARNVVVKELRMTAFAGIDTDVNCNVFLQFAASVSMCDLDSIFPASTSALTPNSRNATPEMI